MNFISISVFGYENKEKYSIYESKKCCDKKHVGFLLIVVEGKRHYGLIKDFNIFMYNHTLYCRKKYFAVIFRELLV